MSHRSTKGFSTSLTTLSVLLFIPAVYDLSMFLGIQNFFSNADEGSRVASGAEAAYLV